MARKDKNITPSVTTVLQNLGYNVADWDDSKSKLTDDIKKVLSRASKRQTGCEGYPDRIYCDGKNKLLILVEEKPTMKEHDLDDIEKGAVSGIKWYLSRFQENNLDNSQKIAFKLWKVLGIAVSGDLLKEYQYKFSCFMLDNKEQKIISVPQITNFVNKDSFLALFNSLNEEEAVTKISSSSKKINNLLRSIDSQKRPILLSALMICLHNKNTGSFSATYSTMDATTLAENILLQAPRVLKDEGIPSEKLEVLDTELAFLKTDVTLRTSDILKQILNELKNNVIPLLTGNFAKSSNYDIIGRFYEEFLKYAGVSNVKKGIVLTPRHITTLFTKLIDLKENDKIVDLCCGTGAFLIAGMNAIINKIEKSNRTDKQEAIANVKQTQLLGFEINPTMYICAISSMMFRGDGKSSIYNYDSIKDCRAQKKLDEFKATIGFINPPYSGKENKEDPTPKEITFLTKLLDNCSRYGIIIAPLSMYFKDEAVRDNILKKHTLKAVINMPKDLFQPNASTHTAIAIFETNRAFNYDCDEVIFYDLRDDGFVLAKNKGRTDIYNKWSNIEKKLLSIVKGTNNGERPDDIIYVKTKIKSKDEWTIYAHSKTDYSNLSIQAFVNTIRDYMIFKAKKDIGILLEHKSEGELLDILSAYYQGNSTLSIKTINSFSPYRDINKWHEFSFVDKKLWSKIVHGKRLIAEDRINGDIDYYSASEFNNSLTDQISNPLFIEKNCIVYNTFASAFYVENEFTASDEIYCFHNEKLNKYNALFITTVMKANRYKFQFGRKAFYNKFCNEIIRLPVTSKGEPDWKYMENYIKSLPYADLI